MKWQRRRRRRRRRKKSSFGNTMWNVAKSAAKLFLNPEYKVVNNSANAYAITDATSPIMYTPFQSIIQGTDNDNRIGRSIKITNFHMRGNFIINSSATQTCIRVMCVLDKQTNGALFSLNQLIEDAGSGHRSIISNRDLEETRRFKVYHDQVYCLQKGIEEIVPFEFNVKPNKHIDYHNNSGTITGLREASLHVVIFSSEAVNTPTMNMRYRGRFLDN